MAKTITLTFNGTTVQHQLGSKAESNPTFRANRINALKAGLVEKFAVQRLLADGIISEDNLVVNEDGQLTYHLLTKSVSPSVVKQLDDLIDKFASQVVVED